MTRPTNVGIKAFEIYIPGQVSLTIDIPYIYEFTISNY